MAYGLGICGRTFHPKYPHYVSEGGGRDTYIVNRNGGLTTADSLFSPQTGFQNNTTRAITFFSNPIKRVITPR